MTTDPSPAPAPPGRLARVSVRTRIAVSVAVLTGLTVGIAGVLVYVLESQRLQELVYADVAQETAELARLQCQPQPDPSCTSEYASSPDLLGAFLVRNVPDDDELFVGWWDDAPQRVSDREDWQATVEEAGFAPAVRDLLPDGGSTRRDVDGVGSYLLTVQPVTRTADASPDALVLVNFLDTQQAELRRTMQTYASVTGLLLVLVVGAAWLQAGRLLRPLRALRANAEELTTTDLSQRLPVDSDDDIAQLTRTYNSMLDRLQQGFAGQRRFLDDAGHELRTPLTVLRGHLEVLDPTDTADVAATRALLLDETERMSRLVDELILLAKSDRPDFCRPEPTGVADLLELVHRKATGLSGDRAWVLGGRPAETVVADLDEQRVTQALLQLCDNAVKHTGPGDRITLAGEVLGATVLLSVTDTGHGVDPGARERIFDRFGRAEVLEGDEGFGLGLSIVRAIADAHGGAVRVEDGPGGGARFVLELPR